jgi:hypothetical protein
MRLVATYVALLAVTVTLNGAARSIAGAEKLKIPFLTPKVPVVHHVGFWPYQKGLRITEFTVEVVKKQDFFHDTAEVRFHIAGTITLCWLPHIKEVHVSERFVEAVKDQIAQPVVQIDITPVVDIKEDRTKDTRSVPFRVAIDYVLHSYQWEQNYYSFKCGGIERELIQRRHK